MHNVENINQIQAAAIFICAAVSITCFILGLFGLIKPLWLFCALGLTGIYLVQRDLKKFIKQTKDHRINNS